MHAQKDGEGRMQGDIGKPPEEKTELKIVLDSDRKKLVVEFASSMKDLFEYLNSNRGVWNTPKEKKDLEGKDKVLVDALRSSAEKFNDDRLRTLVSNFSDELKVDCLAAISVVAGLQSSNLRGIQKFFRENNYMFVVSQKSDEAKENLFVHRGYGFSSEYIFGKIDESKLGIYGGKVSESGPERYIGVKIDILDRDSIITNIRELAGQASAFTSDSVIVIRGKHSVLVEWMEQKLSEIGDADREILKKFESLGDKELEEYAKRKRPDNPKFTLAELTYLKLMQKYIERPGESREERILRVGRDREFYVVFHEFAHTLNDQIGVYGGSSFPTERRQFGDRVIDVISGPALVALSKESPLSESGKEMKCDIFALAKKPSIVLLNEMERYACLMRKAPEDAERIERFRSYFDASREIVESMVRYIEENRDKFPSVNKDKSCVPMLASLSEYDLARIAEAMLRNDRMLDPSMASIL